VEEQRLSTYGPGSAAPATAVPASPAPVRATAPDASVGVGVINLPRIGSSFTKSPGVEGRIRSAGGGVRAVAPGVRSWQPRRHRNPSFRPVALRPRLSTGLPLSTSVKCQSVADFSQVLKSCFDSQNVQGSPVRIPAICFIRVSMRPQIVKSHPAGAFAERLVTAMPQSLGGRGLTPEAALQEDFQKRPPRTKCLRK